MSCLLKFGFTRLVQTLRQSKSVLTTTALLALLLVMPVAALAQGSPFDTSFTAIQSLFTGTIPKVASLVAIVIGGHRLAPRRDFQRLTRSISAANPAGFSYLSPCLVEPANKSLPTDNGGDGLCSTYGGDACSNRTAIAADFRSQYADENFLSSVAAVYVS